jgi:hypothetical protein
MVMGWILEFPLSPWERVGVRVFFVKYPHPPVGHLLLKGEEGSPPLFLSALHLLTDRFSWREKEVSLFS